MKSIPRLGNYLRKMDYSTYQVTKQFKENFSIRQLRAQWLQPYYQTTSVSSQLNENQRSKRKKSHQGRVAALLHKIFSFHYNIPCSAAFGCIDHFLVYASAQRSMCAALCPHSLCLYQRLCVFVREVRTSDVCCFWGRKIVNILYPSLVFLDRNFPTQKNFT